MLKFTYEITDFPTKNPHSWHLCWLIEGHLTVWFSGESCLLCPDERVYEVAIVMRRWLRRLELNPITEFYYASVGYAEEPILRFVPIEGENLWRMESSWENQLPESVTREVLLQGVREYLQALETDLVENYSVDLATEYKEYVDDFLRNEAS